MKRLIAVSLIPLTLTACATGGIDIHDPKTQQTAIGAGLGCAAGMVLGRVIGNGTDTLRGCALGAAAGGYIGWQKARAEELAAAQRLKADLATSAPAAKVKVDVQTIEKTDDSGKTVQQQAVRDVTVDLPTTGHGRAQYDVAMDKIKSLATKIADQRGEATIDIAGTPRSLGLTSTATADDTIVKTPAGNTIHIRKHVAPDLPAGIQRVTVSGGTVV